MKFTTLVTVLAAAIPATFGLTINTPTNVDECEPTQFTWADGTAPFYLSLVPARQTTAPAIKQFPVQNGNSYTWLVDLQAGVTFTASLKDSTGATAYSDIITVEAGTSTSCVNSNVTETGGTSGSSSGSGSGVASTGSSGAASTPASGSSATGTSPAGSATSTSSSSSSTHSNGASHLSAASTFGVVGIMGLVGAMLF